MRWANQIEQYQGQPIVWANPKSLKPAPGGRLRAPMVTLCIHGGKKDKLRPGDILGALTKDAGFAGSQIGKINLLAFVSLVAQGRSIAKQAITTMSTRYVKGRRFKMRIMASH